MSTQPHDSLVKSFLTDIDVAIDFLKAHLPLHIQKRCDLSTLQIEPATFIEADLRQHLSDVLYSLKIDGTIGLIYCIVEAESTPRRLIPLKFVRYQISALKHFAENNKGKPLPVIVPILFYTGAKSPYPYSLNFFDCFADPPLARETFLEINLVDIGSTPDDEIKTHGKAAFLEIVQKHIHDRDILNLAYDLVELLNMHTISRDLHLHMLNYAMKCGDCENFDEFLKIITDQTIEHRENTMTIAERLENRGYQKGILEGRSIAAQLENKGYQEGKLRVAQNMLMNHFDYETIKKITGLLDQDLSKLIKK